MDSGFGTFALEHGDDVVSGAVAEELAEGFFVIADVMLFNERDELRWGEAGECGLGEVGVVGEEVFCTGVDVGEVAAASSGDEDLLACFFGVIDEEDASSAAACFDGAHEACGTCSEDDCMECLNRHGCTTFADDEMVGSRAPDGMAWTRFVNPPLGSHAQNGTEVG